MSNEVTIPKREVRRSFALNLFNGVAFNFAERLIDAPLVLTWFVSQLTPSNFLVGLVSPLSTGCWYLPQVFVSAQIQRAELKKRSYLVAGIVRLFCWLLLAGVLWFVDNPLLLLTGFLLLYTIARLASGLVVLSYFEVMAKTIPPDKRGSLFALRQFLGGGLALGAGWIVRYLVNHPQLSLPHSHAVLFLIYCAVIIPGMAAFVAIREPRGATSTDSVRLGAQLRRAPEILRQNAVYRRYIGAQLALAAATTALPFYGVYAKRVLGAPQGIVGIYLTTRVGAQLLFNLPWGWLSDRFGNRLVLQLASVIRGLTAILALILVATIAILRPEGSWLPYLPLPLFFLEGAVWPTQVLTGSNFLLELVPPTERPLHLGLSNTLRGVVLLISAGGGLLVDLLGYAGLFALSLGLCLTAYVLTTGLPEPRNGELASDEQSEP